MLVAKAREPRLSLLILRATRSLVVAPSYRALVGGIAVAYGLAAMIVGGMLQLSLSGAGTAPFLWIVPKGPGMAWYYPAILAGGPHFLLILPIVSTIFMVLTAAGVGLGVAAAVYLGVYSLRPLLTPGSGPRAMASTIGLTPALLVFLTLGACCSTTAAAGAGIAVLAQSSGTSTTAVLVNTWYLGLFQLAMVYVALLAQEQLVVVCTVIYGGGRPENAAMAPRAWRKVGGALLRLTLIASGLLWAFSGLTLWFSIPLSDTPWVAWFGVLVQHVLPGSLAVLAGLMPGELATFLTRHDKVSSHRAIRGAAAVLGLSLLTWLPSSVASKGAPALLNEVGGVLGWPPGWGAVVPPSSDPVEIALRWGLGFMIVGGFALVLALWPESTLRALDGRTAAGHPSRPRPGVLPGADVPEPG
jgi:hypothetical protein